MYLERLKLLTRDFFNEIKYIYKDHDNRVKEPFISLIFLEDEIRGAKERYDLCVLVDREARTAQVRGFTKEACQIYNFWGKINGNYREAKKRKKKLLKQKQIRCSYSFLLINKEADQTRGGIKYEDLIREFEEKTERIKAKKDLDELMVYWREHPSENLGKKSFSLYKQVFYGEDKIFDRERSRYFREINALSSKRTSQALSSERQSPLESSCQSASSSSETGSKDQAQK